MLAGSPPTASTWTTADLVVDLAGSVVGAQAPPASTSRSATPPSSPTRRGARARIGPLTMAPVRAGRARRARPAEVPRPGSGALALRTRTVRRRGLAVIGGRMPVHELARTALRITAVDAHTGEFLVLDKDAGVPLVEAVAASCAVPASGRR